jgi:hypothetical protein
VQHDRYAAARAGAYTIEPLLAARSLGTGAADQLRIRFRAPGRRAWTEEAVRNIPAPAYLAVLRSVVLSGDPVMMENAKPHVMAKVRGGGGGAIRGNRRCY